MPSVFVTVRVDPRVVDAAIAALTYAGYPSHRDDDWPAGDMVHVRASALVLDADAETQREVIEAIYAVLTGTGIEYESASTGVSVGASSPYHRWLSITVDDAVTDSKLLVVDDEDIDRQLTEWDTRLGVERERLDVMRPDVWPAIGG